MERDSSERVLLRYGAVCAIVGALLAFVANFLHPRYAPDVLKEPAAYLRDIASHGIWAVDHMVIVIAEVLFLFAFVAIRRSFSREPGRTWAEFGFWAGVIATAVGMVHMAVDGILVKKVADDFAAAADADQAAALLVGTLVAHAGVALFTFWMFLLFGLTPILFGLAILTSGHYPRWTGVIAVVAGVLAVPAAAIQWSVGQQTPVTQWFLFLPASLLVTVWVLAMGILLRRRAAVLAPVS